MKETDKDDQRLRDFFAENKQEIADNGFSRRVTKALPLPGRRTSSILTILSMTTATVLFIWMGGLTDIWHTFREAAIGMMQHIDINRMDLQTTLIVTVVLLCLVTRKLTSLA